MVPRHTWHASISQGPCAHLGRPQGPAFMAWDILCGFSCWDLCYFGGLKELYQLLPWHCGVCAQIDITMPSSSQRTRLSHSFGAVLPHSQTRFSSDKESPCRQV